MTSRRRKRPTLSSKERIILELLIAARGMYGLELVAASNGRLKRGTVYVTLGRMEDKGYVRSQLESAAADAGGLPRRIYGATPLGRRVLDAFSELARLLPEFAR